MKHWFSTCVSQAKHTFILFYLTLRTTQSYTQYLARNWNSVHVWLFICVMLCYWNTWCVL